MKAMVSINLTDWSLVKRPLASLRALHQQQLCLPTITDEPSLARLQDILVKSKALVSGIGPEGHNDDICFAIRNIHIKYKVNRRLARHNNPHRQGIMGLGGTAL